MIAAVVLAPYLVCMIGLFGWIVWRMASGAPPLPRGVVIMAIIFSCLTPVAMLATAAMLKKRGAGPPANGAD